MALTFFMESHPVRHELHTLLTQFLEGVQDGFVVFFRNYLFFDFTVEIKLST